MQRKVEACINCQEEREIAAHGLCFKCYRAEEREADNPYAAADRHNRAQLKQLKKLRKCINTILNALDDGIDALDPNDVESMRGILQPYFVSLAAGLSPIRKSRVNSEQNEQDDVHCSQSQAVVEDSVNAVNSEQVDAVHCSQPQVVTLSPVPSIDDGDASNESHYDAPAKPGESSSVADTPAKVAEQDAAVRLTWMPLIEAKRYEARQVPTGGFGIYEKGSNALFQWYETEEKAEDMIIVHKGGLPASAMREMAEMFNEA